jgi:hypothetical protein
MNIKLLILTTSKKQWFADDIAELRTHAERAKGVKVESVEVRHIELPKMRLKKDAEGDTKFDWTDFKKQITSQADDHNAVMLHISREEKRKLGITVNGSYNRDPDEIFECFIVADEGQRSKDYWAVMFLGRMIFWSEWMRLAVHELLGHGFERFFIGYQTNYTHDYDYGLGWREGDRGGPHILPQLILIMDATKWTETRDKRDATAFRLIDMLKGILAKAKNPEIEGPPLYPVDAKYFEAPSQAYGVPSDDMMSGMHNGLDVACPVGTPLRMMLDGQVTHSFDNPSMGSAVYCRFDFDGQVMYWAFLHLSARLAPGHYKRGDIIGKTGNTGKVIGNGHLHSEQWVCPIDRNLLATGASARAVTRDPLVFLREHAVNQ